MSESVTEKRFWRFWLLGILLFAAMIAINPMLANSAAPLGISDHQAAGTAAKVNAIQRAWAADGVLTVARISMAIDLFFIGIYAWGAWNGGKLMRGEATPSVRRIGGLIMIAAILFCLTDYAETVSEFIQVMQMRGSDSLAGVAATVRPVKMLAWLVTFIGLLAALLLRRMARPKA